MKRLPIVLLLLFLVFSSGNSTPVHDLIQNGEVDSVKAMLERNPDLLNETDPNGYYPIHYACYFDQLDLAKYLVDLGADINSTAGSGSCPLHGAAFYGHPEIVKWLVESGADINKRNSSGFPPIISAALGTNRETVDLLIQLGADIHLGDNRNAQLIHYLSWKGDIERIQRLIDLGVDINLQHDELDSPVLWAAEAGQFELYDWLIAKGARTDIVNDEGRDLLNYLAYWGKADRLKALVDTGMEPDRPDTSGRTPIFNAMLGGQVETVKALVDLKADVNRRAHDGDRPLVSGIRGDSTHAFEYFLSCDEVDINTTAWDDENTALLVSIFWNKPQFTKILIDHDANPNIANRQMNTPLLEAMNSGKLEMAELLLNAGADPNVVEIHYGHTPLHKTALMGDREGAELLLTNGAKISVKDKKGWTPIDYAMKYHQKSVENLLSGYGAVANYAGKKTIGLDTPLEEGEMIVWYLGHCAYGIKTANHFLVFDYWKSGRPSDDPCLDNGYITTEELKDQDVYVFVTHEHGDHYDSIVWEWADAGKNTHYIYGFLPENMTRMQPANMYAEYEGPDYTYTAPHTVNHVEDLKINTIAANDAGVGFIVEVDGLVLFHAGDHAGWNEGEREQYMGEIDYAAGNTQTVDMAFLNVTGCHTHCEIALKEGLLYALETLKPKSWAPTHAGRNEYRYSEFLEMDECKKWRECVACPENAGDSFFYEKGRLNEAGYSYLE